MKMTKNDFLLQYLRNKENKFNRSNLRQFCAMPMYLAYFLKKLVRINRNSTSGFIFIIDKS